MVRKIGWGIIILSSLLLLSTLPIFFGSFSPSGGFYPLGTLAGGWIFWGGSLLVGIIMVRKGRGV